MSDDRVRIGRRWRLWEQFGLRGAGFPADEVLRLAPDGLAAAADAVVADEARWPAFAEGFGETAVKTAMTMQEIAASSSFRSAVAWQNRPVLARAVEPFVAWAPSVTGRTSQRRQREELVAHYWQRFTVKNDTIGFFGPVGWGRWDPTVEGARVEPGEGLIAATRLYFSSWAIDTLAKTIADDERVRPWIPPRRVPYVRVDGGSAALPGRPPVPLSEIERAVLARCDGIRSVASIADELGAGVEDALATLVSRRLVTWRLEIPADAWPERHLRSWLSGVGDAAARERGLAMLDALEQGRDEIGAARDPDELSAAMERLEATFAALTDTAATRAKGAKTAPCRALVYSDAVRSARARLGSDVLDAIAPLDLLLTSAAWLTGRLGERVLGHVRRVYDDLAASSSGRPVDLASFWFACMPVLHGDAVREARDAQAEFAARWRAVLPPLDGSRVSIAAADIAERVRETFAEPGRPWTAARYLSPDLMLAARDADAIRRGDFAVVLGELHLAANTLGASLYLNQHPAPEELFALTTRDHPEPRLMPLLAKEHRARLSSRVRQALVRDEDYHVALVDDTSDPRRARTVPSADATVALRDDELVVVLPDGAVFDILDVFAHVLTTLSMDLFRLVPSDDGHTPRVTIDRMVVARETWRFAALSVAFASVTDEARRFVAARAWRAEHGLPRFVFVTLPTEPRPFFVDFDAPMSVTILAKAIRRLARADDAGQVVVTEMLPTPEQAWLTDDQGNRYTSEIRLVAFDLG